jgi:hypothetical protein
LATQFGYHHTSKDGKPYEWVRKKIISGICSRIKPSQEHICGGKSFLYNLTCMGADQQAGLRRADLTGLAYTYAQPSYKKKLNPSDSLLWVELTEMLYVPRIGKRHSFS